MGSRLCLVTGAWTVWCKNGHWQGCHLVALRLRASSGPALCLHLSVTEREASKVLGSVSFFFFQMVCSVPSAFSSCPLGLAKRWVPLHKRNGTTTFWSEICLKTQAPSHRRIALLLHSEEARLQHWGLTASQVVDESYLPDTSWCNSGTSRPESQARSCNNSYPLWVGRKRTWNSGAPLACTSHAPFSGPNFWSSCIAGSFALELRFGVKQIKCLPCVRSSAAFFFFLSFLSSEMASCAFAAKYGYKISMIIKGYGNALTTTQSTSHSVWEYACLGVRFMRNKDLNDAVLASHGPCVFLMPGVIYFS